MLWKEARLRGATGTAHCTVCQPVNGMGVREQDRGEEARVLCVVSISPVSDSGVQCAAISTSIKDGRVTLYECTILVLYSPYLLHANRRSEYYCPR